MKGFLKVIFILILVFIACVVAFFFFRTPSASKVENIKEIISVFPAEKTEEPIRMIFTGDVMLSRSVGNRMVRENNFSYPFEKIKNFFIGADIVAINLEGPISLRGENIGSAYSFRADPRVVEGLTSIQVNVASLANNHMWDWGREALIDTVTLLHKNNILPVGAGSDFQEANAPRIIEKKGTKIAFLSFQNLYPKNLSAGEHTPGVSDFDLTRTAEIIKKIKTEKQADICVVLFHWGEEYKPLANEDQRLIAHALVDAGADLIVGNHPHVVQDKELYKGTYIFYSLGNFVFDQYFSSETMRGMVVEVFVKDRKISEVKTYSSFLNKNYQVEKIIPNP